jgi:mannose-1-phosphate guanylyltransferase
MTSPVIPVILCGGSGTRLWPASRDVFPKQFLNLFGEDTLLQTTLRRALRISETPADHVVTVTLGCAGR